MTASSDAAVEILRGKRTTIYTVGHSIRSTAEFMDLLRMFSIQSLVDIRAYPRSERNPQFNTERLPEELRSEGTEYVHMRGLGGMRKPDPSSLKNLGLRNLSFRAYADYMQTEEFAKSVTILTELAARKRVAVMCAEAVPWKCHRFLLSDALVARGLDVAHIINEKDSRAHEFSKWARIEGTKICYPSENGSL